MATPEQVSGWVGLDVGKESHFADVLDDDGERLFSRAIGDQAGIEVLLDRAAHHGIPGLVIDQPGSIAQLVLAVAARRGTPVAYVPGLVMRRAADLYPGEAKTDRRDAYILAGTARTRRKQALPRRLRRLSSPALSVRASPPCQASGRAPARESSRRSATALGSPATPSSPPMPGSPP